MATVRYFENRNAKKKKRSKGKAKSSNDASTQETASFKAFSTEDMLQRHERTRQLWQLCTNKNFQELRADFMAVRRELRQMAEHSDNSWMRLEDTLSQTVELQQGLKTKWAKRLRDHKKSVALIPRLQDTSAKMESNLKALQNRVESLQADVAQLDSNKDDQEEELMTEWTSFHEKYDQELSQLKQKWEKRMMDSQTAVIKCEDRVKMALQTFMEQTNSMGRKVDAQQVATNEHVQFLNRRVRELSDENGHLRNSLQSLQGQVADLAAAQRGEFVNHNNVRELSDENIHLRDSIQSMQAQLDDLVATQQQTKYQIHNAHGYGADPRLSEEVMALGRDLSRLGKDFADFVHDAKEFFSMCIANQDRLDHLEGAISRTKEVLERQGRMHYTESMTNDEMLNRLRYRVETLMRRVDQVDRKQTLREESHVYQSQRDSEVPHDRRSRSRSRSPPPRWTRWRRSISPSCTSNPPRAGEPLPSSNANLQLRVLPAGNACQPSPQDSRENDKENRGASSQEHEPPANTERSRKRRKAPPEVIVIEDEDEEDDALAPPHMAPPEPALEDDVVFRDQAEATIAEEPIDLLRKLEDIDLGALMYLCFSGAPTLDLKWTKCIGVVEGDDSMEMSRVQSFQRRYPSFTTFPLSFTQFVIQSIAATVDLTLADTSLALDGYVGDVRTRMQQMTSDEIRARCAHTVATLYPVWVDTSNTMLSQLLKTKQTSVRSTNGSDDDVTFAANPVFVEEAVESYGWFDVQREAMVTLVQAIHFDGHAEDEILQKHLLDLDCTNSPASYLFVLLFDVVSVKIRFPQNGVFRLNSFGRTLLMHLWAQLLAKLPYLLMMDCLWLEKQGEGTTPALGLCHMLAVVLVWNSVKIKKHKPELDELQELVQFLFDCLHVNGIKVASCQDARFASVNLKKEQELIELKGFNWQFGEKARMDGLFNICSDIKKQHGPQGDGATGQVEGAVSTVTTPLVTALSVD